MKFNAILPTVSSLFLLAAFSNELPAQTTTSGALIGVVTDASKAVVPDAVVETRDVAKGTVQTAKTDREGVYRFFFLPPGRYILTATHDAFQEETRTVTVLLGPPVSLNISLGIMKASTTVQVFGEAPLLNTENGDVSTTMNQQQISEVLVLPSAQFEAATITNIKSIFGPASASNAFYKQMFSLYNDTPGASAATPGSFSDSLGCNGFVGPDGLGTIVPCAIHFQKTIGQPTYDSIISGQVDWNIRSNDRM